MEFLDPKTGKEQNAETFDLGEAEMPGLPYVGLTGLPPKDGISQIPNDAARKPEGDAPSFDAASDLAFIRHSFPFVPIMQAPQKVVTVSVDNTKPQSVDLPAETTVIKIVGNGDWYVSFAGNAAVPSVTLGYTTDTSLYKPADYFYVRGVTKLSFAAAAAQQIQIMCWNTNRWPLKGRGQ